MTNETYGENILSGRNGSFLGERTTALLIATLPPTPNVPPTLGYQATPASCLCYQRSPVAWLVAWLVSSHTKVPSGIGP